jgi:hypothetical protein
VLLTVDDCLPVRNVDQCWWAAAPPEQMPVTLSSTGKHHFRYAKAVFCNA